MRRENQENGFTLTELIIAIGVLLVIVLYGTLLFRGEQAKARDAERIADMRTAQAAFAVLFNEANSYAEAGATCAKVADPLFTCSLGKYLPGIGELKDPGRFSYRIQTPPNDSTYAVEFLLERSYGSLAAGLHYLTPEGIR
jgi:prepilin-type N-terminal cleavage/methylation domain-containing protein